ncbi:alanine--tRNA ligase [Candidatus Berkelbacteria bacterium]|nr:alanine--tRNA ligase [Candidatus Berkelbacteria bacterium]
MTHTELRKQFLDFYRARGHAEIGQASLVPLQDTSVLFTTAGMHPLIPYLLGDEHPDGTRLVNIQRSFRTTDIDEVGDDTHVTTFEMLGHWSLGDYFKREAIEWSLTFVTNVLGFDRSRLAVTVYAGNKQASIGPDEEAATIWKDFGITRIAYLGSDNWWGPVHATGPCGPTTEIFVYRGHGEPALDSVPGGPKDHEWVEIWNNVFMQYAKQAERTFIPLTQRNIDTGVGLERVLMMVNGLLSVYETDLYQPIVAAISRETLASQDRDVRIIADHIKSAVFLIGDGVEPSNRDRGYVLRRLIRRAVSAARRLHEPVDWALITEAVIGVYGDIYPHLLDQQDFIQSTIVKEIDQFATRLDKAVTQLRRALARQMKPTTDEVVTLAFLAFQSHALPPELGYEVLAHEDFGIERTTFDRIIARKIEAHREISSAGQERKFGGHGLILDTGELKAVDEIELKKVTRLHTATHLLQAALRAVLGDHVHQKGSDITAERLRFDFTHPEKLTDEQKQAVEHWINDVVKRDLPMQYVELPLDEAKQVGALHFVDHKYPARVKVYFAGTNLKTAVSKEFCGGPHVTHTGAVGLVRILKEESSSSGIRRIKAVVDETP